MNPVERVIRRLDATQWKVRPPMQLISRLEDMSSLDRVVTPIQRLARMVRPQRVRDALHGVWLGHPLHPVLVQAPVGACLSAAVLDASRAVRRQARRLVAFGLLASSPAALAGAVDWSEQHEQQMRVGVLHLAANLTATALYGTSCSSPGRGRAGHCASPGSPWSAWAGCLVGTSRSARRAGRITPRRCRTWSSRSGMT